MVMDTAPDRGHSDSDKLLDNATGPVEFRVNRAPARLAVSGSGTLKSWQGNAFDAGTTFTESQVITGPGRYELTLDSAGYATVQESPE
jgi:hypothetical protein